MTIPRASGRHEKEDCAPLDTSSIPRTRGLHEEASCAPRNKSSMNIKLSHQQTNEHVARTLKINNACY